jgi:hypothetical protein
MNADDADFGVVQNRFRSRDFQSRQSKRDWKSRLRAKNWKDGLAYNQPCPDFLGFSL